MNAASDPVTRMKTVNQMGFPFSTRNQVCVTLACRLLTIKPIGNEYFADMGLSVCCTIGLILILLNGKRNSSENIAGRT